MGIEVYLGEPPKHIKDWIINNSKPAGNPKTHVKFVDGTEGDYLIEGVMDEQILRNIGLMEPSGSPTWIKQPLEVNVGNAVTSIGDYAFYYCINLTSVTLHDSVTSIGNYAFSSCSNLTSVTIPNSVTIIRDYAFQDCTSLTSMTIGNGVTGIETGAFSGCTSLTSMTIGNGVTSIRELVFFNCTKLMSITFSGKDTETVKAMEFYPWDLTSGCIIHCIDDIITIF